VASEKGAGYVEVGWVVPVDSAKLGVVVILGTPGESWVRAAWVEVRRVVSVA
jgi:hypothetical protein